MNATVGLRMFPLQAAGGGISDFGWDAGNASMTIVFLAVLAAVIALIVIVSSAKRRGKIKSFGDGYVPQKRAKGSRWNFVVLRRIASDIGLNREKTKMLEFVMRTSGVTDVAQAFESSDNLDRHFKQAYNAILETSSSDEELNRRLSVLFATRNIVEIYINTVNITSTRQIKADTAAILILDDGAASYPTKIVSSKSEALVAAHPTQKGVPVAIARGTKVTIAFFANSNKSFSIPSRVLGSRTVVGSRRELLIAHSSRINKLSKRRFRRRSMEIEARFFLVRVEASALGKQRMFVDKRKLTGTILDISVGGCSMKTLVPVAAGQRIKIEFARDKKTSVAALGEVMRMNRSGGSAMVNVRFLKIPRKSLNHINSLVYEYTR